MSIIIKALLASLVEKKARTFLVLFSIAVSAALVFANAAFSRTVAQRFYDADVRFSGNSDLIIETKNSVGASDRGYHDWQLRAGYQSRERSAKTSTQGGCTRRNASGPLDPAGRADGAATGAADVAGDNSRVEQ